MTEAVAIAINVGSLAYFVGVNGLYLVLMALAYLEIRRQMRTARYAEDKLIFRHAAVLKPVSILAPAFNEQLSVADSMRALLALNYPEYEVILINDGSSDATLRIMAEQFELTRLDRAPTHALPSAPVRGIYRSARFPNLTVIDKENGGKADALNVGLNYARYGLCMAIDTDSLLEKDALLKMVRPFMEAPETVAVGGLIRVVNGCEVRDGEVIRFALPRRLLAGLQMAEYFRAFLFGRAGWGRLNMLLIISGAFGMFRADEVIAAGGYWTDTVGEDMELVVRLHRRMMEQGRPYAIRFVSAPVCWTEAPETVRVLGRQRNRWARGLFETALRHRRMLLNPAYGRLGLLALPFNVVVEGLGGVMELVGLLVLAASWYAGLVQPRFVIAWLAAALLLGIIVSWSAVLLDEVIRPRLPRISLLLRVLGYAALESFGYRQLNAWWRIRGLVAFLRGDKAWGRIVRTGFDRQTAPGGS